MSWLPLAFGFPAILWGLLALPAIWWLLRLTPPKPQTEVFPPLRVLAQVLKREEQPQNSPWWLTLLRLLLAALVVLALAEPTFNPRERVATSGSALALVIDNSWASATDWDARAATARRLIADADHSEIPIILAFTAEKPNAGIGPYNGRDALNRLNAVRPQPIPADRPAVYSSVSNVLKIFPGATIAVLSDGLAEKTDSEAFSTLFANEPAHVIWAAADRLDMVGLTGADNAVDRLVVTAVRASSGAAPRFMTAGAFDGKGRRIGDAAVTFRPGETVATGEIVVPFELRNDFASIALDGEAHAAGMRLLDDSAKRRRVGLLSQTPVDEGRQLLSPLYYIRRALEPYADLIEPASPELTEAVPQLLEQKPAVIMMGDVGAIPDSARAALLKWMEDGGTLVRFASSRLITSGDDPDLLPVKLRLGERLLGGSLSWSKPQAVTEFPANGPFSDLPPPSDVTVTRQILAEPTADLASRTWATLADGTPLVTADRRSKGIVVLFHVTPLATWSNLPISGTFVEMLRRIVQLSRNQGAAVAAAGGSAAALPPYRMISADGLIVPPGPDARPLDTGRPGAGVTLENPPGLYGTDDGVVARNLLEAGAGLAPIVKPSVSAPLVEERYGLDESRDLTAPLLVAALIALAMDGLIVLWLAGRLRWKRPWRPGHAMAAALSAMAVTALLASTPGALADDSRPGDAEAIAAISTTRLAYVVTGDSGVDAVSRAGLEGLRRFLVEKTALEPGEPAGVDIAKDELAFYPMIYWPIDPAAAMPTQEAMARIDEYMKQGGTVLFDTRDQYAVGLESSTSPETQRLRDILGDLNVPALEPAPEDHVLTKSFFILDGFPGRFNGGPLWVEASLEARNTDNRPVRTGDGVSPIMITSNDFAGAWAVDADGAPLFPTVPDDPMQRIYALRAGVNMVMYMLTGNYKSDQVHVPALLERLGQ